MLTVFLFWISLQQLRQITTHTSQSGSQVPLRSILMEAQSSGGRPADPRVGSVPTADPRAPFGAKISGKDRRPVPFSWMRKRAYKRACRRAMTSRDSGTMYRGHWCSLEELQGRSISGPPPSQHTGALRRIPRTSQCQHSKQRLRVITYNVGGMTMTVYDTLRRWLHNNQEVDVLLLQEIHWSLGREETSWAIPGWLFIISPDPGARHSGVGVVISRRIASAHTLSFCTWLSGRILQVRCEAKQANLDIICAYQWVRRDNTTRDTEQLRGKFWSVLSGLLAGLPRRNMLVLGGDFNSMVAPLPGLIGRGLLPHPTRKPEPEFLTVLEEHKLCLLNTWSKATPAVCATFRNGAIVSQIDFVAVRRRNADALARRAKPTSLDLAPGREGPKHRVVAATVPIVPGWRLHKGLAPHTPQYSKEDLARELQYPTARTVAFRSQARAAVMQATAGRSSLQDLNRTLLRLCQQHYPAKKHSIMRPGEDPAVTEGIREMWRRHRALKTRQAGNAFRQIFSAWLRYRDFMRAWRALRAISRNARKRWLEGQVTQAEEAAAKHDMRTVYRVIQRIAPKRRYESVRIRGADGRLLNKAQQFQALLDYFRDAFRSLQPLEYTSSCADPQFTLPEIVAAIQQLKNLKAVPAASPTAEVWKHCPQGVLSSDLPAQSADWPQASSTYD